MAREEVDLKDLYTRASTKKGSLTRAKKALDFAVTALKEAPASVHFFEDLKKHLTKYRNLREAVLDTYDEISAQISPEKFQKDFGKQSSEIEADYEKIEEAARKVLSGHQQAIMDMNTRPQGGGTDGGATHPRPGAPPWKLQTSFQPKRPLKLDSLMNDFHCWERDFQAFYDISNLQQADMHIQRTVLLNCLDADFQTKISAGMSGVTTIEDGLELVKEEFRKRHPLILRRHQLFCLDQNKDENKFSDTVTRMMIMAKDANLVDMTRDEILCHILLKACSRDDDLRSKLLEIDSDTMTLDQLVAIIERYEVIQLTNKGLEAKEKAYGKKVGSQEARICYCCQELTSSHWAATCPVDKKTLFCEKCHQAGLERPHNHNTFKECQGKPKKVDEKTKEQQKPDKEEGKGRQVRTRGLSPAGQPESSDSEDEKFARRVRAEDPMSATSSSDSESLEDDSGHFSNTIFTDTAEEEDSEVETEVEDTGWPVIESAELRYRGRVLPDDEQLLTHVSVSEGRNVTPSVGVAAGVASLAASIGVGRERKSTKTTAHGGSVAAITPEEQRETKAKVAGKVGEMQCNRYTASGRCCLLLAGAILLAYMLNGLGGGNNTNSNEVPGDNNSIQTDHIPTLATGQKLTNEFVILGFLVVLAILGACFYHQRVQKRSRQMIQDHERDGLLDKINAMEEVLLARGFLKKLSTKKVRKSRKTTKAKKKATKKNVDIEAQSKDSSDEDSD